VPRADMLTCSARTATVRMYECQPRVRMYATVQILAQLARGGARPGLALAGYADIDTDTGLPRKRL
jgi:hypothetical protein